MKFKKSVEFLGKYPIETLIKDETIIRDIRVGEVFLPHPKSLF